MRRITRISVLFLTITAVLLPVTPLQAQTPAYFVVGRPGLYPFAGDSYVLPLTDPVDIAQAREMASGPAGLIVVATVTAGSDGINRNVSAPGEPLWSWHVKEFLAFAEVAIELCDGTPTMTETGAQGWPPGYEEDICYWDYTVVDEIPGPTPVENRSWGAIKALFHSAWRASW